MYMYIYSFLYMYIYMYIFQYMYIYMYLHIHIYIYININVCVYIYIYTYLYVYAQFQIWSPWVLWDMWCLPWMTWLIRVCDMTHSHVTWGVHICDRARSDELHDAFIRVTCNMTRWSERHDSSLRGIWFIHVGEMTHSYVWHDPFSHIHMSDIANSYTRSTGTNFTHKQGDNVWHDASRAVTLLDAFVFEVLTTSLWCGKSGGSRGL